MFLILIFIALQLSFQVVIFTDIFAVLIKLIYELYIIRIVKAG